MNFSRRTNWNSPTNRLTLARQRRGSDVLDLTETNPTRSGIEYPLDAIAEAMARAARAAYTPDPRGLLSAREAVAQQLGCSADDLVLTASTSEAYAFLFKLLCDPGDELLIPGPSYPLFDFLADIQDVQLRRYELFYDHGWHIDIGDIAKSIHERTRGVLVVNPNNPTGSFLHAEELRQLTALCRDRELTLISDEVFLDYEIEAAAEVSVALCGDCLSFALSGLSKISCVPQMKLAWMVVNGPEHLRKEAHARLEIIADTYLSVNAPIQYALPELLKQKQRVQSQLFERIRANLGFLDAQLEPCRTVRRLKVEGGWYATLRVPAKNSDEELAIDLIEQAGVIVHPGHFYDFPQDGYLVVSLITPDCEFQTGILALLQMVE